jgi:hypothetical protein
MDKNRKKTFAELKRGNNLEIYLPQFFNRMATAYSQYAELEFTMYYYSFYESYLGLESELTTEVEGTVKELNRIVSEYFSLNFSGNKMEKCIKSLDKVRNHMIDRMNIITTYADILQIYEYVLNRIEFRYDQNLIDIPIDEMLDSIKQYIFKEEDNYIVNERIKEVIGQLPIRMTKSKFFDLIHDSLSLYSGADRSALDSYVYMIKIAAMLHKPEGMDTVYPRLNRFKEQLESIDYKNISKEEYSKLSSGLLIEADFINKMNEFYYEMMQVINPLYAVIINNPYSYMDINADNAIPFHEKEKLETIVVEINEHFSLQGKPNLSEELEHKLIYTEGKQEQLLEELQQLESVFYAIKDNSKSHIESLMLRPIYTTLCISEKLLGSSLFVDLNSEETKQELNDDLIKETEAELFSAFTAMFDKTSKSVIRAVMASVIKIMPVFFQNSNEVMDYISYALEQCKDLAEKTASITIIKSFWKN